MYWATGILGLLLVIAPFVFGYTTNGAALWTSLIIGGATAVVSWIESAQGNREMWEYWTAAIFGVVAVAAPFLFGFSGHGTATWTTVIVGVLIAVFAGSKLLTGQTERV